MFGRQGAEKPCDELTPQIYNVFTANMFAGDSHVHQTKDNIRTDLESYLNILFCSPPPPEKQQLSAPTCSPVDTVDR